MEEFLVRITDRQAVADGDSAELERRIVAVTLCHDVLSRFTAYLAIDHSEAASRTGGLYRITQPVEHPSGRDEVMRPTEPHHPATLGYASPKPRVMPGR